MKRTHVMVHCMTELTCQDGAAVVAVASPGGPVAVGACRSGVGAPADPAGSGSAAPAATPTPTAGVAPAPDDHGSRGWIVFAVTALGAFMASLDLSIVNVAFPALQHSFPHDARATLAWVITAYTIVFASLLVTAGRTADRLGRRRIFFAGLGVFTLGSALCALAPSVALLIGGRVVQGVGAAAMVPSSVGLLLGAFPDRAAVADRGPLGGRGGPGGGDRPIARRRPHLDRRLAVGLLRQPPGRPGGLARGPASLGRSRASAGTSEARPDYAGVALLVGTLAALVLRHLRRTQLGLEQRAGSWPASWSCPGPGGGVFVPLGPPSGTGAGPAPLLGPVVFRGQCRRRALRHGLLRHAPRQRAVPDRGVALLDHEGRTGHHPGSARGRGRFRPGRSAGGRVGFRAVLVTGSALLAAGCCGTPPELGSSPPT